MTERSRKQPKGFYTLKGYDLAEEKGMTCAMEDYLEMLWRIFCQEGEIREKVLAEKLHVKPSSVSKMMTRLKENEYVDFQPYGTISLTEKGKRTGEYLLLRHQIIQQFLCWLNQSEDELEQAEKIEHFLDAETVWNMKRFLEEKENF